MWKISRVPHDGPNFRLSSCSQARNAAQALNKTAQCASLIAPYPCCGRSSAIIATSPGAFVRDGNYAHGRGRDEDYSSPPAQIPACAANAPGSSLGSNVGG